MSRKLKIAMDLDGCWFNFTAQYTTLHNEIHGTNHSDVWGEHNEFLNWGQTVPEFLDVLAANPDRLFGNTEATLIGHVHAREIVERFDVTFVTARNPNSFGPTVAFLNHVVGFDVSDKILFHVNKSVHGFDLAVDDHPKHLFEYAEAGTPHLVLIGHGYNQGHPLPNGTATIHAWDEFIAHANILQSGIDS